jgi:DNA replication and repair protein RecF
MIVRSVTLEGFRNYRSLHASFADNVNVIVGNNAQGKTNLIEAVYFLSAGRSFRARNDRELIHFEADTARLCADIHSDGREHRLEALLSRTKRRQFQSNAVRLKTAAELSGKLRTVLFCPDDLNLIREGAAVRRRLLDGCLCQLRPRYAAALTEYHRLLEHKTRILRDYHQKPSLLDTLEEFNFRMAQMSAELIHYRSAYSALLSEKASVIHRDFSGDTETLSLRYCTVKTVTDPSAPAAELLEPLLEHLRSHRNAELETGTCLSGAHKDDLEIEINGKPARAFASQGQARTAALSLKLAERDIHFADRGDYPVLLLDDVLSELDTRRQSFVLNRISEGQIFITCCDEVHLLTGTECRRLRISGGQLIE